MKRLSIIAAMLLLFMVYSCNVKTSTSVSFNADFYTTATLLQMTTVNTTDTTSAQDITTNIATLVSNNSTTTALISSVKATTVSIIIPSSSAQTFSFLSNARVFISKPGGNNVEIGNKLNISNNGREIDCDLDNDDVTQILTSNTVHVIIVTTNSQVLSNSVMVNLHLSFHFQASSTNNINI